MHRKTLSHFAALAAMPIFTIVIASTGCAAQTGDPSEHSEETTPEGVGSAGEALSSVSCTTSGATGYRSGSAFAITVVHVDGKAVEEHTANAYYVMAQAAARDGVNLHVVSGFRTMAEQQYLYGCYVHGNCNNGNLAAKPGYSNHQSGHALDLNTSAAGVYNWLANHAHTYGFARTVPSEAWHWEWWGGGPGGGPCSGGGGSTSSGTGCHSDTLGTNVANNACVQSKYDQKWYQCDSGNWVDRFSDPQACSSVHPL